MRLFIGLALPGPVRDQLARLQGGLSGARWVAPDNLHVTLRFLGEVSEPQASDLDAELGSIAAPAFETGIIGLGVFDRRGKVHTLWAELETSEPFVRLHAKAEQAAQRAGFEAEGRKFRPHATLARFKSAPGRRMGDYLEAHGGFRTGPFTVDELTLFRSHLNRDGATYEPLAHYPLLSGEA